MADYYSLLARAVAALPQPTPEARQSVYERARKALFHQLRGIQPPVAEADIVAEGRALEEAIARLEIELAKPSAPAPATSATPTPPASPPPRSTKPAPAEPANRREAAPAQPPAQEPAPVSREPQRPAAPLPPAPERPRATQRVLAVAGVLLGLVAVVGGIAWQMRERPEDLGKLKLDETTAESGEAKISERVDGADSGSTTKPATASANSNLPVAQKAELWVASLASPDKVDKIYNAIVVWKLDNVGGGPGEPVTAAVRGEVDIPDAKAKLTLIFRKNSDQTLSASHTINVSFNIAPGSPLGGVKAIGPIQMRRPDAQSGEKVAGIPVPITDNNFLIGLMRGEREQRNIMLMRTLGVIDLPMQLNDGRAATISMEKGASGERAFDDAIAQWSK